MSKEATLNGGPVGLIKPAMSFITSCRAFLLLGCGALLAGAATADAPPGLDAYRRTAMTREGDPALGRVVFEDTGRAACTLCHSVDGSGSKAGPDLGRVGDQFSRRELIDAVLTPSASIAVGYATTLVTLRDGAMHQGVLKSATAEAIELAGPDGSRTSLRTADIRERTGSAVSLMPEGLHAALSPAEFADLVEYLVSLKEPANSGLVHQGMPEVIPLIEIPVTLRPMLDEPLQVVFPPGTKRARSGLVWFGQVPGHPDRFLAMHQVGKIWLLEGTPGSRRVRVFADLTDEVFSERGPNGLLGLAFHPQFTANRKYYLKQHAIAEGEIVTRIVERTFAEDFAGDSGKPGRELLRITAGAEHHNGGCLEFGPDGLLYIGMGDSAPNFDPQGFAQDPALLFGKMLRIDVDRRDPGLAYAIPRDNPFVGQPGVRPEIWASGLREPFRFSFDPATGELWAGDLGQERGDEVSLIRKGGNYGWNVFEGFDRFGRQGAHASSECVAPLFVGRRKYGACLIGGHVYRGAAHPDFQGVYIFGDFQSKRIWGLTRNGDALGVVHQLGTCPQSITAFAADEHGELFVVGYEGMIYELDFAGADFNRLEPRLP